MLTQDKIKNGYYIVKPRKKSELIDYINSLEYKDSIY